MWPLALGAGLAGLFAAPGKRADLLGVVAALMILGIYVLLEGWPAFPPIASKQKLAFLIMVGAVAVPLALRIRVRAAIVTAIVLTGAAAWLGWNKLTGGTEWLSIVAVLVPVAIATAASPSLKTRVDDPFLWPAALLCFAVGAAILSGPGLGGFVGFTQVMGAFGAWMGGFILVRYILLLAGRDPADAVSLGPIWIALLSFVMAALVIGLFAPGINRLAFAILSIALLVPLFAPRFDRVPRLLKPFALGLLTAIPAAVAILIAFQQSG